MKKMLAMALALLMVAVLLPVTAMAAEVEVTPGNIPASYKSDTTYRFKDGTYDNFSAYLHGAENVTFIADTNAKFNGKVTLGYHSNQDKDNPASTDSTLTVEGFHVDSELFISAADNKVIVERNMASQITVKTFKSCKSITVMNNTLTGGDTNKAPQGYGVYIVPNITGYDLIVNGNTFTDIQSHAISVQGNGDGSAETAANSITVSGNNFDSYGINGKSGRAAVTIWEDNKYAPSDTTEANEAAQELAKSINENNNFGDNLGENCVAAEFYGAPIEIVPQEEEPTTPGTITIIVPSTPTSPEFLSGANQTVGVGAKATFRIDKDFVDFMSVAVDGITLDKTQYKAWSGSTYVELLSSYMKTLSEGTHTLSAYFNGATATTAFTISKTVPAQQNPATGANDFVGAAAALAAVSLLGMAAITRKK